MALIKKVNGVGPKIGQRVFLAETASIIGDVTIGDDCTVWYNAVLRGDVNPIVIGNRVNIQDGAVLHTLYKKSVVKIGDDVSIGHNAIVHGANIQDRCLIGMGATLLDNVLVQSGCIVAANALVLAGTVLEPGSVYAGIPARKVKEITEEQRRDIIERTARDYIMYSGWIDE
ncbi:MAG: gamma carbonic anhydrase family protein [Rikenellaceae bacterium]|nr:gamma carbonic anhydrase family protein [Rikenellaceae bacterium]